MATPKAFTWARRGSTEHREGGAFLLGCYTPATMKVTVGDDGTITPADAANIASKRHQAGQGGDKLVFRWYACHECKNVFVCIEGESGFHECGVSHVEIHPPIILN